MSSVPSALPLIWLDLETTGLDPQGDVPLQVAVSLTDRKGELYEMEWTLRWPLPLLKRLMDPYVLNMHTKSGLLVETQSERAYELGEVNDALLHIVKTIAPVSTAYTLAGNSIHFDRAFIRTWFPDFDEVLHHRMLDVSAVNLAAEQMGFPRRAKGEPAHTALADVRDSIANFEHWRATLAPKPARSEGPLFGEVQLADGPASEAA